MDANTPQPPAGDGSWMALLDALPDEQKKAWLGLANVSQQQGDLDEQMKRAEALRKPPAGQPYGLAAGVLSGLSQGLNAYTSQRDMKKAQADRAKLYGQVTATRADVVKTLADQQAKADLLRQQQSAQQAAPGPYPSAPQPVEGQQDYSQAGAYPFLFGGQ